MEINVRALNQNQAYSKSTQPSSRRSNKRALILALPLPYLFLCFISKQLLISSVHNLNMQQPKILVAIRKRPLSKKQASKGEADIVAVKSNDTVIVSEYKQKVDLTKFLEETIFNFDFAFNQETQNQEIYDMAVRPLVDSAFQGAKVTCFAYGQTGSGKTYTMNGNMGQGVRGLYTLGANDIFAYLQNPQFRHLKAKLSFFQIYCGKLFDLLNKRQQLKLREDNKNNINIIGLEEAPITSQEEFIDYLALGSQQRVTSQNSANADSSRSHAILQVSLKDGKKLFGKISFIDLAGNERGADHMDMDKQTRIDGAQINKSLLSLKECIRALDQGKGHTPFRGSKLTMVLKDSFVGFCRTVMIGNVSPSSASSENTLNTLRYADRVKQLRKPQQGGGSKEEMKAKEMMLPRQNKNAIRIMINNDDDADDIARKRDEAQKEYGVVNEEPKKPIREETSLRKTSFGANKLAATENMGKDSKSSSIAKNVIGNGLTAKPLHNNLTGNQMNIHKPAVTKTDNTNINKYSHSTGVLLGKRQQPMEIESPSPSPYYLPSSSKNIGGNQSRNNNCSNLNNMSNLSQNNLNNSVNSQPNVQSFQNRGMVNNQRMSSKNIPLQGGNMVNSYGNYGQNNGYQNNPHLQNQSVNYHSNQNISHHNNYNNYNHQNYIMPENWNDLVATVSNSPDPVFHNQLIEEMNARLFNEEDGLMRGHSETLRREIDIIKQEMHLLGEMEIDRGKITSRGYVRFMQDSIEEKISHLQMLRQRLISFTYKLDEMEEIEGAGRSGNIDDEQLLDDIN